MFDNCFSFFIITKILKFKISCFSFDFTIHFSPFYLIFPFPLHLSSLNLTLFSIKFLFLSHSSMVNTYIQKIT